MLDDEKPPTAPEGSGPTRDEAAARVRTVCLAVLTTLAVGATLRWLAPVMIPFVLAVFFSLVLSPVIKALERHLRLPRPAAVATTVTVSFLFFWLSATLVTASIAQLSASVTAYQSKAVELIDIVTARLPLAQLGLEETAVYDSLRRFSMGALGNLMLGTTNAVRGILSNGVLVMIFMVFLLLGTTGAPVRVGGTWSEIESRTMRYLVTKGVLSAATGVLVGAVLTALGIDLALVFGLFAFLLNFIPSIGSIIATLLPLPVVIVAPGISLTTAVLAIVLPGVIQFTIGNLIEPKVMGDSFGLHPVAILLNLMLWGMLWGIVGMLLATPLLVMIKILCERVEATRPVAALIAGRVQGINA